MPLDSTFLPYLVVLALFGTLLGFFRHLLTKVVVLFIIELVLFILFPSLLIKLASLIGSIRGALG